MDDYLSGLEIQLLAVQVLTNQNCWTSKGEVCVGKKKKSTTMKVMWFIISKEPEAKGISLRS